MQKSKKTKTVKTNTAYVGFRTPTEAKSRMRRIARTRHQSVGGLLNQLVEEFLAKSVWH